MSLGTVLVMMNDSAGRGRASGDSEDARLIEQAFTDAGVKATVLRLPAADMAETIGSMWAADDRPDAVVVAGGDGTVNCAANAVVGTDVVLGVLPAGTFNHFARDIGSPVDMAEAVRALVDAEPRLIDVAEVNGRVFVNNSVLGVYPEMVDIRDKLRSRHGWGKVRAVPVAAMRVLRSFPTHRLDLTAPGGVARRRVRTPLVFVGNGIYDSTGRGMPNRESLTGGRLGVGIALSTDRAGLFRLAWRTLRKGQPESTDVDTIELAEVTITSRAPRVKVAVDGEITKMTSPLIYRSRPESLRVLMPTPIDPA
jgi:diacylglycerol kinase family enzyme